MPLTLGLTILVSGAFGIVNISSPIQSASHGVAGQNVAIGQSTFASAVMSSPSDPAVERAVRSYFADAPIMIAIADCESNFHQYDLSGNILKSVTDDIGVMQINEYTHRDDAVALGYDITTVQGNMAYARWLYDREGTSPWLSSSKCWAPRRTIAVKAITPALPASGSVRPATTTDVTLAVGNAANN